MNAFQATRLVAGRELRETFRRRSYWAVLGLLLVGASLAVILPEVLAGDDKPTRYDVAVVGGSEDLVEAISLAGGPVDAKLVVETTADEAAARRLLADEDVDVAVLVGPTTEILVEGDEHRQVVAVVQQVLAVEELAARLGAAGLSGEEVRDVLATPPAEVRELDSGRESRRGGAAILSIVLYVLLLMLMVQVANGVAIEKANRISEVLLAIVRPGPLMFGKVIGVGVAGVLTTLAAAVPVLVKGLAGGDLPAGLGSALVGGAAWLLLGIALYLTVASALGALVERQEEAGSVVAPLNATLLGGYLVAQSAPDSPVATVLAYIPFTSPLVVPVRMAVGVTSTAEAVGSLALGLLALVLVGRFGATVYRRAIVRTGRKLKLRDVLRQP